jgi:hypothetical protein
VTKALVALLARKKNQELDEGVPQAPDPAFPGKTVSKALPPSLFAELSQQEVMHAGYQRFRASSTKPGA